MQACGKPDLPLAGLSSFKLHAFGRTEPAPLDLMPLNSHLSSPSLTDIVVGTTTGLLLKLVWA